MTREDQLIKRIEQGESDAVDELIKMFYPEILRYCIWHAPNRSLAEDATQETFLKVIRYLDRYTHKGKFRSFLYQVATNTCIDLRRKHSTSDSVLSIEESEIEPVYFESGFEDIQSDMVLKQLISHLSSDLQEIVLLRFGQDLTIREIAEVMHMPLRTAQSKLRSALKTLKKEFEKGGPS